MADRSQRIRTVKDAFDAAITNDTHSETNVTCPSTAAATLSESLRSLSLHLGAPKVSVQPPKPSHHESDDERDRREPADEYFSTAGRARNYDRASNIPLQIQEATVNRAQARQRFMDLHFGTSTLAPFVFVHEVFHSDHEQQVATTAAVDTMCIAQMATSFQDAKLMEVAGVMYSRVAHAISRRLRSFVERSRSGCLDDVFGGIHALITCAFFSGLKIEAKDRESHVQGLKAITKSIPNERMSNSMREAFKYKWGRQGFWLAIKQRKNLSKGDSRIDFVDRWRITDSDSLSRLASYVPGLLERADIFCARGARGLRVRQSELLAFSIEIETTVLGLKEWQLQWGSTVPSPYHFKSIRSFEAFRGISGPHFELFKTAYSFSNPASERDFRILQICLLSLDLTVIQLHEAFPRHLIDNEPQIQLRRANFGAELAAEALCMMVPWTSRPENMAFAGVYTMPLLERAVPYFQERGKRDQVEWCKTVSRNLGEAHGVDFFVGQG